MQKFSADGTRRAVYALAQESLTPIDVFKESKRSGTLTNIITSSAPALVLDNLSTRDQGIDNGIPLDFKSWLPYSAPHYHISPDPKDYILTPVIILPSDLPNRNGSAFPLSELVKFDPEAGQQAYKTWKGKPTHLNHQNEDITKAYGVIADTVLRKLKGFNQNRLWKVLSFLAFDRSKHADTCQAILDGSLNSYSMGAWISNYSCSVCGALIGKCGHLHKNKPGEMYQLNGQLAFRNCIGITGFETSAVEVPAYVSAISDQVEVMA